jgi:hypothetical protein
VKINELIPITTKITASKDDVKSVGKALKLFKSKVLARTGQIRKESIEVILDEWLALLESNWLAATGRTAIIKGIQQFRSVYENLTNAPSNTYKRSPEMEMLCQEAAYNLESYFLTSRALFGELYALKDFPQEGDMVCGNM